MRPFGVIFHKRLLIISKKIPAFGGQFDLINGLLIIDASFDVSKRVPHAARRLRAEGGEGLECGQGLSWVSVPYDHVGSDFLINRGR